MLESTSLRLSSSCQERLATKEIPCKQLPLHQSHSFWSPLVTRSSPHLPLTWLERRFPLTFFGCRGFCVTQKGKGGHMHRVKIFPRSYKSINWQFIKVNGGWYKNLTLCTLYKESEKLIRSMGKRIAPSLELQNHLLQRESCPHAARHTAYLHLIADTVKSFFSYVHSFAKLYFSWSSYSKVPKRGETLKKKYLR